jgi:SAM-dependent methyltransferase
MPKIDNEKFYTSAIEKFGTTARGLNWASRENQQLRFKELVRYLPTDMQHYTLVDAGCGFGDLYHYLCKKKRRPKNYIGLDTVLDMYSIASEETAQEIIYLDICKDSIPSADYYICSGALNVLTKFETYQFIRNCFLASNKAFIFNALFGEKQSETYNYLSIEEIKKIAKELEVEHLSYHHNYMENDITVIMSKKE